MRKVRSFDPLPSKSYAEYNFKDASIQKMKDRAIRKHQLARIEAKNQALRKEYAGLEDKKAKRAFNLKNIRYGVGRKSDKTNREW